MATNSFIIKGWSVTIIAGLFALPENIDKIFIIIAILSTLIFAFLDAYYLQLERKYRQLYNEVIEKQDGEIDFSMNIQKYKIPFCCVLFSKIIMVYWLVIILLSSFLLIKD
ncbi:hypothetical protein ACI76O_10785 [Capnocytophaga cynodegmi]